ncbi:MAG TPA: IPT/TIG domain-containing protein [Terriglobales bacterium]|nr:IPT/TIG domain-containing protein [Terriglobales bacterium]
MSGFNPGLAGTPITWAGGAVHYYTDQGPLSPTVSQEQANALVADAFALWTAIPTAAVVATRAGSLDEDVSGDNVTRWSSLPPDIQSASTKPVAIVYDYGGEVLDALLGSGAGADCETNPVLARHDAFTPDAHFQHALLLINGNCAIPAGMPYLRYRLQRAVGTLLGLDWSQVNDNVDSGSPEPTPEDYAGFPLMHAQSTLCTVMDGCTPLPGRLTASGYLPAMDDRAALSRLYPVTTPGAGKVVFRDTTARVRGTVQFASWQGLAGQGMQGVNVVATLLDANGNRATSASAAGVSGFRFRGNAGNPVSGTPLGEAADRWGSADASLQGYFDLSGLELPEGASSARYELRAEPVRWPLAPYGALSPAASGSAPAVVIAVSPGSDVVQDFVMPGSLAETRDNREPHSFAEPAAVPGGGVWAASLSPYGDVDWHRFTAHGGRVLTLDITAVDEGGAACDNKALPVAGIWPGDASQASPPLVQATYLNAGRTGLMQMQTALPADGDYKLGIADYRGDGRPDYRYLARLLTISEVRPPRASAGTVLTVRGMGFTPGLLADVGGAPARLLWFSADELMVEAPPASDGAQALTLTDAATGAIATATLMYGAGAGDRIATIGRAGGLVVPVAAEIESPIRVLVTSSEGAPVSGATVTFSTASAGISLLPCNAGVCVRSTDATGEAWISVRVEQEGEATISATLPNGAVSYAMVVGVLSADAPTLWSTPQVLNLPQGTSAVVPLTVRLVFNGLARPGRGVEFDLIRGAAVLSATSAITDAAGQATITVSFSNLANEIVVIPHLQPNAEMRSPGLSILPVPDVTQRLQVVSGDAQIVSGAFQPVAVRVVDSSGTPNPVPGVAVQFQAMAFHPGGDWVKSGVGDLSLGYFAQRSAVAAAQATVTADAQGYAAFTPAFSSYAVLDVQVTARIAGSAVEFNLRRVPAPAIVQPTQERDSLKLSRDASRAVH